VTVRGSHRPDKPCEYKATAFFHNSPNNNRTKQVPYDVQSVSEKTHKVIHMTNLEPFAVNEDFLHQIVQQRLLNNLC